MPKLLQDWWDKLALLEFRRIVNLRLASGIYQDTLFQKAKNKPWVTMSAFNPSTLLWRQRWEDLCKFMTSLVYKVSSRSVMAK